VVTADIALAPACTTAAVFVMTSVEPPPVSAMEGFFSTVVSKSSNMSAGMYGVTVQVCVIVDVRVMVAEIKSVFVGVTVVVRVIVGE
jgi:hypothetical protein